MAIKNYTTNINFERDINDISIWKNLMVISWIHPFQRGGKMSNDTALIDAIACWISDLKQMEKDHLVTLDHRDCGDLARLMEQAFQKPTQDKGDLMEGKK